MQNNLARPQSVRLRITFDIQVARLSVTVAFRIRSWVCQVYTSGLKLQDDPIVGWWLGGVGVGGGGGQVSSGSQHQRLQQQCLQGGDQGEASSGLGL